MLRRNCSCARVETVGGGGAWQDLRMAPSWPSCSQRSDAVLALPHTLTSSPWRASSLPASPRRGVHNSFPYDLAACLLPTAGGPQRAGFGPDSVSIPQCLTRGVSEAGCRVAFEATGCRACGPLPGGGDRSNTARGTTLSLNKLSQILLKDAKCPKGSSPQEGPARCQNGSTAFPCQPRPKRRACRT